MGRLAATILFALNALWVSALLPPCSGVRVGAGCVGADSIRGPWEWRGQDVIFELRPSVSGGYDFVVLNCADPDVAAGAVKGQLMPLADEHKFDLLLEPSSGSGKRKPVRAFIATFDRDWRGVTLHSYNRHRTLTLDRLFPYIFRLGFSNSNPRPNDIEGAENLNLPRREGYIVL